MRHIQDLLRLAALLPLVVASCHARPADIEVEKGSPAVSQGRLIEDIGIETLGGVFTSLLDRGQSVPCEATKTFSTAADNQAQIQIRMLRGTGHMASDTTPLGHFAVASLPKRPRGTIRVAVTIAVSGGGSITISAKEASGYPIVLRRDDK